ncbi:MAG: hypothetical protein KatS3mg058_3803 [Roseiflexus sp.]|nr:MAG: hypothetical protein KatS3mg058_3803 [Roseiflexus sp.]
MTLDDAACVSFRAQRLVIPSAATCHSERSDLSFRAQRGICAGRARPLALLGVTMPDSPVIGGEAQEARGARREARGERREVIPMTLEDAACLSFRALRFAQGKRSEESERDSHDDVSDLPPAQPAIWKVFEQRHDIKHMRGIMRHLFFLRIARLEFITALTGTIFAAPPQRTPRRVARRAPD